MLYVNGSLASQAERTPENIGTFVETKFLIGKPVSVDGNYGDFLIDDMYFWNVAMETQEIELLPTLHLTGNQKFRLWALTHFNHACLCKMYIYQGAEGECLT